MSGPPDVASLLALAASPLGRFVPWVDPLDGASPQREVLRAAATTRRIVFRAANRTGKSYQGAADTLLRLMGWHPFARARPPIRAWASALDWDWGVGQVIWPAMKPMLPSAHIKAISWYKRGALEFPQQIRFRNGSELAFKSAEAGREKYQGASLDFLWLDEEHPADVVEEARARLLTRGGDLLVTATPVRRERWLLSLEREAGTVVVRASMDQAVRAGILDREATEAYLASLSERQRQVRGFGDFAPLAGLVYPEWSESVHVLRPRGERLETIDGNARFPWPLPTSWPRYASMDFGYSHPTVVVLAARSPDGHVVVERCYYQNGIRGSVWARILKEALPPLAAPIVCDHDLFERAELEAAGLRTTAAVKDVVPGLEAVERALTVRPDGRPRLHVVVHDRGWPVHPMTGRCDGERLAWEMQAYRYPEPRAEGMAAPRDLPVKVSDDCEDALRYLIVYLDGASGRRGMSSADLAALRGPRAIEGAVPGRARGEGTDAMFR